MIAAGGPGLGLQGYFIVSGEASLAGELTLTLNNYNPLPNHSFNVMGFGSLDAMAAEFDMTPAGWTVSYTGSNVRLVKD